MANHSLMDDTSIAAWIAEHEPEGESKLRQALNMGTIQGRRAVYVADWFRRKDDLAAAARDVIAERSATASERSASWTEVGAWAAALGTIIMLLVALLGE